TRTAVEVTAAVQELALKLKAEGLHISRVHADRARELRVEPLRRWLLEKGILVTYTEGQAPQANGRAEAAVKWTKAAVKRLLMASGLGKENWAVAANYAVHDRLERTLRRSSSMLPFGTKVHVRSKVYGTGGRYDLNSRWQAGSYVGPSLDVRGGHVIRLENGAYMTSTHLRPHLVEPDKIVELDEYEVLLPMPTRRLRTKAGARVLDPAGVADEPCLKYDPGHPAEQYAMRLLDEDILTPDQCEILALMLPSTAATPKRFGPQGGSQKVWSAGAFVHGGVVGVKTATVAFPASTRVFVKYAKQLQPDHKFNAVAITVDIGAQQHVDAHNVGLNLVAGLSFFKGGGLEIEESEGKKLLPLDGDHTHQLFDPHVKHSTRPWYSGSRVVLVAYSVRDSGKLSNDKVDYLKSFGFEWIPHTSRTPPEEESLALRPISVSLLDAAEVCDVPEQHRDSPEQEGVGEVVVGCDVPEQPRDSPEQEGVGEGQQLSHPCYDSLCYLTEDVELAIGDLEDRAARLRDLLEEEEIMCEEYRRMGQVARDTLGDARAQVCEFLEGVHEELIGLERQRTTACLKAARATATTTSSDQIDYEEMLSNMEGDLKIVHTVPIEQVKRNLSRWVEAIRKEVTALLDSGTLRRISLAEARQLEKDSRVMFAPAKCVFTLKPPQEAGKRARRKCRVVICGNYIRDNLEFGDLYASGTSTDALRLSLVIAALRCWLGAVSDITGAFLLASWPPDLPKYGIYPPRVVKDSGVTEAEAWIVERPLYGLRESPRIWSLFRNERLRRARIKVGEMTLVLRPTVAEPELWMILCEVTGSMHGLIVLYVDDIAYFSTEEIIKAIHEFIVQEWPASPLEWISADAPVRYLGVEIWREPRTSEGGEASWVYTIGQSAYVKDLLREHNMSEVHPTDLPAPREWIEEAESSEEVEGDYDESTLKLAQRHVGECLWLATKTRPDIMFVTTHAASLVSKRPSYVIRLSKRVLAYLAGSADLRMTMGSIDEDQKNNLELIAFTDASYAPYGKRSFGAAVITLAGSPVAWKSGRQSFITLSVMEAELYAATQGCTLLNSVEALAAELLPTGLVRVLAVDNTSAAAMLVRLQQLLGLWGFVGFSVNLLETVKLKGMREIVNAKEESTDHATDAPEDAIASETYEYAYDTAGEFEERARIAKDTLMLMRVEELKSALRLEGMLVSGLKNDLAERLLPRLVGTDVTNKQLKYVLFLWRAKALEYKCILRWEDINNKYRVSAWISRPVVWTVEIMMFDVELRSDPREACLKQTLMGVGEILAGYVNAPAVLEKIFLRPNQTRDNLHLLLYYKVVHETVEKMFRDRAVIHLGMAQLQSAMSESLTSRSKEPEVVKPGLAELPRLPEMGQNSAIDIGDWLHGLQNHMGDLSNNSGVWWAEVMACLSRYYEAYLAASHVGKLAMNAEDYESDFLKDGKWSRVDKRASSMILACVSDSVKSELLSTRLVGTLAMLSRIVVLYRPGSIAERQQVLRALENPHQAANAADAVVELRKWARWMARATDIGIQCPDASVLVRGLDSIVRKVLADHADIAFRISMLRYTLEVDTRPTIKGARDLQQALMSELEQVAFRSRATAAPAPSVKAASVATPTTGAPRSEQAHGQEANSPTARAKTKAKTPCRFFLTDKGCSKGSSCTYSYAFTRKEKQGRYYRDPGYYVFGGICGTYYDNLTEASAMLKEIRQLKTLSLTTTQASQEELLGADHVRVQLAGGREVVLSQGRHGSLLAEKTGAASSAPIVPLGALVQELGCQVSWSRRGGLVIRHPQHGAIRPEIVGRCPVVAEAQALDLIKEIESQKLQSLENATGATARALWLWDSTRPWARHLSDFVKIGGRAAQLAAMTAPGSPFSAWSEMERALIAENIELSDRAGWSYLRALPGSRQRRKRMMALPWVVHLYSGPGRSVEPVFRELDDGRVLVQIDINRSKAEDMNVVAGAYRALLWAAATGRIDGIIGSPPNRPELVQRMMWLTVVAKAARAVHGGHPVFALIEGCRVLGLARRGEVERWSSVSATWGDFLEATCLEEFGDNLATNLRLKDPIPESVGANSVWTFDFKEAVVEAIKQWGREPEALQVMKWIKKLDAADGSFLGGFTDKELEMWRTHVYCNGAIPSPGEASECLLSES
ncbi:RE1, partial [Symbiodinium sp. KB8]